MPTTPTESHLRRVAARLGLRVWKPNPRSPFRWQYGPYALVDTSFNGVVSYGMDAEELAAELAARH